MKEKSLAFKSYIDSELNSIRRLADKRGILKQVHMSLKGTTLRLGVYELNQIGLSSKVKQRFSYGGLCINHFNEVYNPPEEYWLGGDDHSYILMSDNKELYAMMYSNFTGIYSPKYPGYANTKAMFQVACGDWEGLAETMTFIAEHGTEDFWQDKQVWLSIYQGFLGRDVGRLGRSIAMLDGTKLKKQRISNDAIEKHISPRTIAMAKCAWMHGMEVEVNSKYVPKELLPFEPLEEYTIPYKFLRDYYRPLGYTWRYDPIYPELQDWDNDPENPDKNKGGFLKRLFS